TMPIRFRCAYCNQLMGIARRKAGTVVHCPKCKGQVIVPTPENAPPAEDENPFALGPTNAAAAQHGPRPGGVPAGPGAAGAVFERSDFENLFQPVPQSPQAASPQAAQPAPAGAAPASGAVREPAPSTVAAPSNLEFERVFPKPTSRRLELTPTMLALAGGLIVILMGLAFFVGLLMGRTMVGG